uniref:Ras-related protein Rab-28 n=1 Tax=Panagrolaimus sp. PS1159 TaxID=55785 RepID=A0AC35FV51_9BILA
MESNEDDQASTDLASTIGNTSIKEKRDSDDDDEPEMALKLVVVGDGTTGKTSLCTRFAQKNFNKKYTQTVGVDFFSRLMMLKPKISVLLQIWDIGGQSLSTNMLANYLYGAHAVLFVYDVVSATTFENLAEWIERVKSITKNYEKQPIFALIGNKTDMEHRRTQPIFALIGNKTDMEHRRTVRIDKHNKLAQNSTMNAFYVSAKTGDSVDLCFRQIAGLIMGVNLSKTDLESDISIVKAPVTVCEVEEPPRKQLSEAAQPASVGESLPIPPDPKKLNDSSRHSSVCSVQ